jgi:hypothetical protein
MTNKRESLSLALVLLLEADQDAPLLEAARLHAMAQAALDPYAGCGQVDWATRLISTGKTRNAIHALRVVLANLPKEVTRA